MPHYSGQALFIEFSGVEIHGDHRGLDVSGAMKIEDTTAGADVAESHIGLTSSATIDLTVLDDDGAAGDAVRAVLVEGTEGVLTWGPEGGTVGKPMYSCNATVTSENKSYPYDGAVEVKVTFTRNGDWLANYDADALDVFGP